MTHNFQLTEAYQQATGGEQLIRPRSETEHLTVGVQGRVCIHHRDPASLLKRTQVTFQVFQGRISFQISGHVELSLW